MGFYSYINEACYEPTNSESGRVFANSAGFAKTRDALRRYDVLANPAESIKFTV